MTVAGFAILVVILYFNMVIHELGHATIAKIFGYKVKGLVLGVPQLISYKDKKLFINRDGNELKIEGSTLIGFPPALGFKLLGLPIQVTPIPLMGGTDIDNQLLKASWWKQALVFVAGPLVNILFYLGVTSFIVGPNKCLEILGQIVEIFLQKPQDVLYTDSIVNAYIDTSSSLGNLFYETNFLGIIWYCVIISIVLGVINLIPITPLDGGRILLSGIDSLFGHRLPRIKTYTKAFTRVSSNGVLIYLIFLFGKSLTTLIIP